MALRLGLPGHGLEASEISGTGEMDDGSRFSELRTQNFELRVALYASHFTNDVAGRASFAETAWHDRELDRPSLRGR